MRPPCLPLKEVQPYNSTGSLSFSHFSVVLALVVWHISLYGSYSCCLRVLFSVRWSTKQRRFCFKVSRKTHIPKMIGGFCRNVSFDLLLYLFDDATELFGQGRWPRIVVFNSGVKTLSWAWFSWKKKTIDIKILNLNSEWYAKWIARQGCTGN